MKDKTPKDKTPSEKSNPLKETMKSLEEAMGQWDSISATVETESDEVRKRTRELLIKLSEQIQALDL